jgi:hypothetical protein
MILLYEGAAFWTTLARDDPDSLPFLLANRAFLCWNLLKVSMILSM